MAYIKLEQCPCGRCRTSWERGMCCRQSVREYLARESLRPANWDWVSAIADEWSRRCDEADYTEEDEREWFAAWLPKVTGAKLEERVKLYVDMRAEAKAAKTRAA